VALSETGTGGQFGVTVASPGATSITIPSDAVAVIVFVAGWSGSGTLNISSLTLSTDGSPISATQVDRVADSGDQSYLGAYIFVNPATGTRDLTPTLTETPGEGCGLVWIAVTGDLDTGDPIRDFGQDSDASGSDVTLTVVIDSITTDLAMLGVTSYASSTADGAPSGSGQTVLVNGSNLAHQITDIAREDSAGASSTTLTGTGSYSALIAMSLQEAAAGGGPAQDPIFMFAGLT